MKSHHRFFILFASLACHVALLSAEKPDVSSFYNNSWYSEYPSGYPLIDNPESTMEIDPAEPIDLNLLSQDFILETKKIEVTNHPFAFNPSIVRWKGSLLLSFRTYNPVTRSTNPFGLVWLDESFNPISTPQIFELPFKNPVLPSKQQDPRLVTVGDRLYVVYNNILENITHREMRRMFISEISFDGTIFTASDPECISCFEGETDSRYEKNWPPFDYQDNLHLSYSLIPHKIFRPILGTNSCETVCCTNKAFKWNWGVPRGGTQAILDGDHYLGFFHSWADVPTTQSGGKRITHYVMGAYTFEAKPPFKILSVSPEPIVAKDFYEPPYYRTWKPLRCVFPSGLIVENGYAWVAYGRQDHEMWVAKIDKKKLLKSLIPVTE